MVTTRGHTRPVVTRASRARGLRPDGRVLPEPGPKARLGAPQTTGQLRDPAESRWLIFPSLQAEVFLPVIVFISPKEQGPAGAGAPARARDKAHSRAPPGRGEGQGGAALRGPPAGRPQLPSSAAPPTPAARRPIRRVCCPGARAPETPVRARPHGWGLAPSAHPHRPSRPISGPGMRSPQARSLARSLARGALTREAPPPPHHHTPRRRRAARAHPQRRPAGVVVSDSSPPMRRRGTLDYDSQEASCRPARSPRTRRARRPALSGKDCQWRRGWWERGTWLHLGPARLPEWGRGAGTQG
ncbi:dapper homolog 3-like [Cervus elaphus]|uniref:dapper homolog 3-like n=1 Tax=Cervus elaphus TaxID=9860 RepID=UPI001CC2C5FC|nr:dapper homolog 3-like [Cervus elaphus]